ncbi:beta-N-acetylhexosaminidase [Krasilnikoviella flava]|uniref:beta-N-acetylhexosaminidase n=1 Tax=Krasilnikoviella flava TaxID=526729 RepID=A0A1T5LP73_9MICO|nr:beta-N-acetylhexosaminidase [Krasilnikoviella flava]SKC77787.1 hexosaminidase [Krasilnikoviella flava]
MPHATDVVPAPASLHEGGGEVVLPDGARVAADPGMRPAARWWRRASEDAFGVDLVPAEPGGAADVTFVRDPAVPVGGYRLTVADRGGHALVHVAATDGAGALAGAQTLRQLAGPQAFRRAGSAPLALPVVTVEDGPRFGWRGVLLDVARHFLPKADVLRFVDLAAAHHLNVLQLHLTDDQGWRIEVQRYPRLTQAGSWRRESGVGTWRAERYDGRPHGGYYTRDDLREIVAYARERGVTVVPEIGSPGHVQALLTAYPELAARPGAHEVRTTWGISEDVIDPSPAAVDFFAGVLDEVCDVFDSPFVALGGDEVPTTAWRERPDIVARAAALGLVGPDGEGDVTRLHGWFLSRLADHLRSKGRRAVVWDEAFGPDLPRDVVVTCWRGHTVAADALAAGHDVVMAPEQEVYLDHRAAEGDDEPVPVGFARTVDDVRAFEPLPAGLLAVRPELAADLPGTLLGAQAQVWSEHLDSVRRLDYAAFPRLVAFAEAVWNPAASGFDRRLREAHLARLDAAGVEYRPLDGPRPWQRRPGVAGYPRDLAAERATAGWAGMGGWVEGRDGAEPGE